MFKKLRKRLILTLSMIGVAICTVLFTALYIVNYSNAMRAIDMILTVALSGEGQRLPDSAAAIPNDKLQGYCFLIEITSDGNYNLKGMENFSDDEIDVIIQSVTGNKSKGNFDLGESVLYFKRANDYADGITRIAVFNATVYHGTLNTFSFTMVLSLIISYVLVIIAAVLISDHIVSPTENAWQKQNDLITNASHELKTPITVIDTNIAALDTSSFSEQDKRFLGNIEYQTVRMNKLICEMLELARLDNSPVINKSEVNVSRSVSGILLGYEAAMFEKSVRLEDRIQPDITLTTDSYLFEKLVYILLDNAFKYTNKNGKISVLLEKHKKSVVLKVSNSGGGISSDMLDKVFERFYRADKSHSGKNNETSFGLGLSIAKSITENLGGSIKVESDGATFTCFTITFKQ